MRKSIDGLSEIVRNRLQLNPFANQLYLFCGRRRDRLKGLYWEGDGFVLLYKRLENGQFQWPMNAKEAQAVTWQEFRWLMEGLSICQPKAVRRIDEPKHL